ncbi:MGMT family protein [Paenibacillus sp. strain BS8-2]
MQPFTKAVIDVIKSIPEGRVMTYGGIAEQAGSARGARQVVRILHAMSESQGLPWHRVVNAKGEIAVQDDESRFKQELYLNSEGVKLDENGRIDLVRYRHRPDNANSPQL